MRGGKKNYGRSQDALRGEGDKDKYRKYGGKGGGGEGGGRSQDERNYHKYLVYI